MFKGKKETFFDVRVIRRNLEKGLISHEDYKEYLGKLEDNTSSAVEISINELDQDEDFEEEAEEEVEEPDQN